MAEWLSWLLYRGSLGKAVHDVLGTPLHSPLPHMRRERIPIFYGFSPQVLPRPLDWLFPRVAAIVHHGGAGTTGAGLRAGLPSLIAPFLADQFFWGQHVYKRGLGPQPIEHTHVSAEALARAITTMVTDQAMRQRAATAGERIREEDGVGTVVRLVERSLAGSSRTPLAHAGPKKHLSPIVSVRRDKEARNGRR